MDGLRRHSPQNVLSSHNNIALTIIGDHFAQIANMNDGNSAFGETSYEDEVLAKLTQRHI